VGRTRLQKSVYLLKLCGIDLGFDFEYHHYGPYSEDLTNASRDAEVLGLLDVEWKNSYGNEYAVFHARTEAAFPQSDKATSALSILNRYETTVLELAATVDFLRKNGYRSDPWAETARRKTSKITTSRVEQSKNLLRELESLAAR
jgi:uncharacterized protein YwgA